MFTFSACDEGFAVAHDNGHGIANIVTKGIVETNDPNLRVQKKLEKSLPFEKWSIHFTGYRFYPGELEAFLKELAAKKG